jgi:hypothetical protein
MAAATCAYPGCARPTARPCDRCRRDFCDRHIEPMYPDAIRSPFRCALCAREARQAARAARGRPRRGILPAVALLVVGVAILVVGTALAPSSDRVTLAGVAGMLLAGVGAISLCYSLFTS